VIGIHARAILRVAGAILKEADEVGIGRYSTGLCDAMITYVALRRSTRKLFLDGHYGASVQEAYKCLNIVVKQRSGLTGDGASLMNSTFSIKDPILKVNALISKSDHDQQLDYMQILAGCMTGIRNPRAHQHDYPDQPVVALELLTWANHLMGVVRAAKRTRTTRKKASTQP
jgi:uncharacterized protein (TIGR02391 family)